MNYNFTSQLSNQATPSNLKKGLTVFYCSEWNFRYPSKREPHFYRDDRGRCVYVERENDIYTITEWEVYSIGKKRMLLISKDGKMSKMYFDIDDNRFSSLIATTKENAIKLVEEVEEMSPYKRGRMEIVFGIPELVDYKTYKHIPNPY